MPHRNYFVRQAASLLRLATQIRNPEVATVLMVKAADFNEKLDQLPPPRTDVSPRAPDVEPER